jgi:hypothetical protein
MIGETLDQFEARRKRTMGAGTAAAPTPETPKQNSAPLAEINDLVNLAPESISTCQLARQNAIMEWRLHGGRMNEARHDTCVAEQTNRLEPRFEQLRTTLASNPRAMDALRDLYATWKAALMDKDISSNEKNSNSRALVRQKAVSVQAHAEW